MALTYEAIATTTVGSGGAASITFSSIPNTYTDLLLVWSARQATGGNGGIRLSFNNNSSNYSTRNIYGSGSSAVSSNSSNASYMIITGGMATAGSTASTFSNCYAYIPNYTSSNNKSVSVDSVNENNATEAYMALTAGLWSNTSVIDRIDITSNENNLAQHSTATLYGIKNTV